MNKTETNFVFTRHSFACHNLFNKLDSEFLNKNIKKYPDPELTEYGVIASIINGKVIKKVLYEYNINHFDIIGCSGLIRSMETAFYLSRQLNAHKKIYVFPLLRELDESSDNKYSIKSKMRINTTPSYQMESIAFQKDYLKRVGILQFFDFTFIEKSKERNEPGDINSFINWFNKRFDNGLYKDKQRCGPLNVMLITHAGVLKDFAKESFNNNTGFILTKNKYISLKNKLLNHPDFISSFNDINKNCPSTRCKNICQSLGLSGSSQA